MVGGINIGIAGATSRAVERAIQNSSIGKRQDVADDVAAQPDAQKPAGESDGYLFEDVGFLGYLFQPLPGSSAEKFHSDLRKLNKLHLKDHPIDLPQAG
jgi:hypothetical protein